MTRLNITEMMINIKVTAPTVAAVKRGKLEPLMPPTPISSNKEWIINSAFSVLSPSVGVWAGTYEEGFVPIDPVRLHVETKE